MVGRVDTRDLRDPEALGKTLLHVAKSSKHPLSVVYDRTSDGYAVPIVSRDDSMGKACAAEYRAELEAAAAAGDVYAASRLRLLDE